VFTYALPTAPVVSSCATNCNGTTNPASGGTQVTITGSNFSGSGYTTTGVTFGGVAATTFNVVNNTTITATSPAAAGGTTQTVAIGVTTQGVNGANTCCSQTALLAGAFTYTASGTGFATYYINLVSNGASDSNDGLSPTVSGGHGPWVSPLHSNINCGDTILVQPNTYGPVPFHGGSWGQPNNCGGGNLYAVLKCNSNVLNCIVDAQIGGTIDDAIVVTANNWAIVGMTATNNHAPANGQLIFACFVIAPANAGNTASQHHILLINSYGHDCTWSTASDQGDYIAFVGVLLWHGAYDITNASTIPNGSCPSNYSTINPFSSDADTSIPHHFWAGLFSLRSGPVNPNCVDDHGIIFDGWGILGNGGAGYNRPWVIEQSLFIANANAGLQVFATDAVGVLTTSTLYGNEQSTTKACAQPASELSAGNSNGHGGGTVTVDHNIIQSTVQNQTCTPFPGNTSVGPINSPFPMYAIGNASAGGISSMVNWTVQNTDYLGVAGQNFCNGFTQNAAPGVFCNGALGFINGTGNTNQDPGFGSPTIPTTAPNCTTFATVYACLHANGIDTALQPAAGTTAATNGMGYRPPGPCGPDANWPTSWVPVSLIPTNLVTTPCPPNAPSVTINNSTTPSFVTGAPPIPLAPNLVITQGVSSTLSSATVSIIASGGTADTLACNPCQAGVVPSGGTSGGTLTLTANPAVPIATMQAALRLVTFSTTSATNPTRTIQWVVTE
jgi:hypothetical protein